MKNIIDFNVYKRRKALAVALEKTIAAGVSGGKIPQAHMYMVPCFTCNGCGFVMLKSCQLKPAPYSSDKHRETCPHCKGGGMIRATSHKDSLAMLLRGEVV